MARKRMVAPSFFKHADLYEAEASTGLPLRVAFAGNGEMAGECADCARGKPRAPLDYEVEERQSIIDADAEDGCGGAATACGVGTRAHAVFRLAGGSAIIPETTFSRSGIAALRCVMSAARSFAESVTLSWARARIRCAHTRSSL